MNESRRGLIPSIGPGLRPGGPRQSRGLMEGIHAVLWLSLIIIAASLAGCCHCPPPVTASTRPIRTETLPMDLVIAQIDHNAIAVPSLWTQLDYSATVVDPTKKTTDHFAGDGTLLFSRPGRC